MFSNESYRKILFMHLATWIGQENEKITKIDFEFV